MPGPALTESRWAPAITTLASLPVRVSATTLYVVAGPRNVEVTTCSSRPPVMASWSPTAWVTDVTGMSSAKPSPRVPLRSVATLLAMTTAEAPAACAFCALMAKVQPPRG